MFCKNCGKEITDGSKFCSVCGCPQNESVNKIENANMQPSINNSTKAKFVNRIKNTYIFSVISAAITLIIRLDTQQTYYSWSNLLDNRKVVGLDEDVKPFLTVIPVIATIIVSLLIVSDKQSQSQKKLTAFIVNAIFILLSVLFIWFDIPYSIVDF